MTEIELVLLALIMVLSAAQLLQTVIRCVIFKTENQIMMLIDLIPLAVSFAVFASQHPAL
jgi:hypothetical protein